MSTHATIAVLHKDGTITQIYCHRDGYLEHCGITLNTHYSDQNKAEELVHNGHLLDLDDSIERCITLYDMSEEYIYKSYAEYEKKSRFEEYNYLFKNGEWEVTFDDEFMSLNEALTKGNYE